MAHVDHYTKTERFAVIKEAVRDLKEYKNYVDPERTHLNYALVNTYANTRGVGAMVYEDVTPDLVRSVDRALKERVEEYQQETGCQVRKNSVVLSSWVVQCPEALRGNVDDEKRFFNEVNGFMMKELGKENVIATFVHYDETTPHCHVHTVPCGHNRNTGKPAIGSNAVYTREYLKDFHVRFNDHMEAVFGIKNLIVTEERVTSQRGNLSLVEFKKAKLTEEVEKLTEEVEHLEICKKKGVDDVLALQDTQRDLEQSTSSLRARMDELEVRNQTLTKENEELKAENDGLETRYQEKRQSFLEDLIRLKNERDQLQKENNELQDTVNYLKTVYNGLVQKAKTLSNKLNWWVKSSEDIETKRRSRELKREIENEFPEW